MNNEKKKKQNEQKQQKRMCGKNIYNRWREKISNRAVSYNEVVDYFYLYTIELRHALNLFPCCRNNFEWETTANKTRKEEKKKNKRSGHFVTKLMQS